MKKAKIEVTAYRRRVGFNVMEYDRAGRGFGVSFSLTQRAAVELADKLNALLDDPGELKIGDVVNVRRK